jgi:hypothetical protein
VASGSSLLRQSGTPLRCAFLVLLPAFVLAAPAAGAPPYAPDPSPLTNLTRPDPYPAQRTPAARTAEPIHITPVAPVHISPVHTSPVQLTTVPVTIPRLQAQRTLPVHTVHVAAAAKKTTHRKPVTHATRPAPAVETIRSPDHPVPRFVALGRTAIDAPERVSRTLALALALLVLLSASLVAGAARELAR